jgi:hypothetical protein
MSADGWQGDKLRGDLRHQSVKLHVKLGDLL